MNKKVERSILIRDDDPLLQGSTLVVGIDKKGHIIRFNETLEQLTGSSKKEVINVPFASYFSRQIPQQELQRLIQQARYTPDEVDVDTSFKTIHGEDVVVSWTGFAVKNEEDGQVSQLNLVGTPQQKDSLLKSAQSKKSQSTKESKQTKKNSDNKQSNSKTKKSEKSSNLKKGNDFKTKESDDAESESKSEKLSKKNSNKPSKTKTKKSSSKRKISIRKPKSKKKTKDIESETNDESKEKDSTQKPKKKRSISIKRKKPKIKKEDIEKDIPDQKFEQETHEENGNETEDDSIEESNKKRIRKPSLSRRKSKKQSLDESDTSSKKPVFSKKKKSLIRKKAKNSDEEKDVEKSSAQLLKENKRLQKQITVLEKKLNDAQLKREEFKSFFNARLRFIRDSVGIAKKRDEFKQMMQQLTERKQKLEQLETDMILEKKEFKQKIEEFVTWREKLETLEQEIEKRRQFLSDQEQFINEKYDKVLYHELSQPASYVKQMEEEENDSDEAEYDSGLIEKEDLFNSLTVEAAVLQRGRIKKINKLFANMLGFSEKDLVGKHLVDFVTPLGLEGVEHHYMNRLKGVDDSSYQTVFLSKSKDEIPVKVNIKNTDFHGERAEIVTFNEM